MSFQEAGDAKLSKAFESKNDFDRINEIVENRLDDPKKIEVKNGTIVCGTDEGFNYKRGNEDTVVINTDANAFASIDGMGGMGYEGSGEIAAHVLAVTLQEAFEKEMSIHTAQILAQQRMKEQGIKSGGACYLAAKITGRFLDIYQAGDVRLIIIDKSGQVRYSTHDEGVGNTVFNAVQGKNPGKTSHDRVELQIGDRIITASDGLTDNLNNEEIAELIRGLTISQAMGILEDQTRKMMERKTGKPDNRSIIIYDIERLSGETNQEMYEKMFASKEKLNPNFDDINSWDELFNKLDEFGEIQGSQEKFSATYLKQIINYVRSYIIDVRSITSTGGLRKKVIDLIEKDRAESDTGEFELQSERKSNLQRNLEAARNINELKAMIKAYKGIKIKNVTYLPDEILKMIEKADLGLIPLTDIPYENGLRKTISKFLIPKIRKKIFE